MALKVEGRAPAVVSVPRGARGPRPLIVAAHGNYDKPEWQCHAWRLMVGDRGFVLCPRGVPRRDSPPGDERYEYASGTALEQEVDEAIAALARAFEGYVDVSAITYAGFSLGAHLGVRIVTRRPERFPRAAFVEGGERWSAAAASAYVRGGGRRALWACGQAGCVQPSERSAALLGRAGGEGRVVYAKGAGHSYGGPVGKQIAAAFDWLVEGDARWADAAAPSE